MFLKFFTILIHNYLLYLIFAILIFMFTNILYGIHFILYCCCLRCWWIIVNCCIYWGFFYWWILGFMIFWRWFRIFMRIWGYLLVFCCLFDHLVQYSYPISISPTPSTNNHQSISSYTQSSPTHPHTSSFSLLII